MDKVGETLERLREEGKLPRLIAFDLDYTLWSCYCEFQLPPFTPATKGAAAGENTGKGKQTMRHSGGPGADAFDKHGAGIRLYPDVRPIFQALLALQKELGGGGKELALAVASRTPTPDHATQLLTTLGMLDSFQNHQIFPGSKITHFNRIRKQTRLAFEDMIFFDDERRNVKEVGAMGVTAVLVDNGLTCADFLRGLNQHAERRADA
jgi:magnesium-dependent phosphatase 1